MYHERKDKNKVQNIFYFKPNSCIHKFDSLDILTVLAPLSHANALQTQNCTKLPRV